MSTDQTDTDSRPPTRSTRRHRGHLGHPPEAPA